MWFLRQVNLSVNIGQSKEKRYGWDFFSLVWTDRLFFERGIGD